MIDIKDIHGITIASVSENEGSKRKFMLMKEDFVMIKFSLASPIVFGLGSYIETDYGRFEICDEQKPSYNTVTGGYDYELRFDASYWKWKNKIFKFTPEAGGQEASWNLTASLDVQLGVFLRNLKALGYSYNGVDYTFSIDSSVENKAVLMSYDNTNLLDALFLMASKEKWNCDCWITDNVIHFGRCEFGDAVKMEQAVNADITRNESKGVYATRVYAFGSTKNIPQNYRPTDESVVVNGIVQKRLMLPAGTPYIDAYRYYNGKRVYLGEADYAKGTRMPQEEAIENVIVLEHVYPKLVGTMSEITTKEYTDKIENQDGTTTEKKWNAYRYKDSSLQFSKDYILPGQELNIYFQSGKLNGMVFSVKFNPDENPEKLKDGSWNPDAQLWEIVRNETYGRPLPDDVLKPSDGDKFVLTGFDTKLVGETMVPEAEQKLKAETEKYVKRTMMDDGTYTATLFPSWVYEDQLQHTFGIGQKIDLVAPELFEEGRVSRVIGYEFCLDIPYDHPVYTIGESAAYSRIGELEDKVESLTYKGQTYEGGSGSGVYLIRTNDSTVPTNSNAFSALRTLAMFIRKDQPDQTAHLLKLLGGLLVDGQLAGLLKGATFGNYQPGQSGGSIDERGVGELKKLLVREGIESTDYNAGALGTGFALKTDPETGRSYLEVDELMVRVIAVFVELEIRKLSYAGGNWVFSAAGGKCARVEELSDRYRCYLVVDDGKAAVENEFRKGDQVQYREFNIKPGVHENVSNRYYWRLVVGVGEDYIDLSKSDCDKGSVAPAKGDDMVQLGNRTDVKRQNAIVISAYGEGSPSITQHKGIKTYSLAGTEKTRISPEKNVFTGEFHFESGVSVEESVNNANSTASSAQSAANAAQGAANNAVSKVETLRTETSSKLEALNDKIAMKVESTTFNELKQQVQKQESELSIQKDAITQKVSSTEFNSLTGRVSQAESSISTLKDKIALKVDETTFDTLKQQVTSMNTELTLQKGQISSKVSKTEVEGIVGGKAELEARKRMLVPDGTFRSGLVPHLYTGVTAVHKNNAPSGCPSEYCGCSASRDAYSFNPVPVTPGEIIHIEATCNTSQTAKNCAVGVRFFDSSMETAEWLHAVIFNAGLGWARKKGAVTAPSNARHMQIWFQINDTVNFGKFYFTEVVASDSMGALSYSQGLVTRIEKTETSITQLDSKISLKAEKSVVDSLGSRLSQAEVKLEPDQIWLKVSEKVNQVAVDRSKRADVWVDARSLNQNTYYPVTIGLSTGTPFYRIIVSRTLDRSYGVPSWGGHAEGFSLMVIWTVNAAGWGTIGVQRMIESSAFNWSNVPPVGNINQLRNSSTEYIYVRGGSMYNVIVEGASDAKITLRSSTYTVNGESVSPVSSVDFPWREQPTREEIKAGIGVTAGGITMFGKIISLNGTVTFDSLKQGSDGQSIIEGGKIKTSLINVKTLFAEEITATRFNLAGGYMGGFIVNSNSITSANNAYGDSGSRFFLHSSGSGSDGAFLGFRSDSKWVGLGLNCFSAVTGETCLMRLESTKSETSSVFSKTGLYIDVAGAGVRDDSGMGNNAIWIRRGHIAGLRRRTLRASSNPTNLKATDSIVICVNTYNDMVVNMPPNPEDGQEVWMISGNKKSVQVKSTDGSSILSTASQFSDLRWHVYIYDAHNRAWLHSFMN